MKLSNARYGVFLAVAVSFLASCQARIKGVGPFDPVGPSAGLDSFRDLKTGNGQTTNAKKAGKEKKSKGGKKFESVKEMRKEAEKEKNNLDHPTYEKWVSEGNEQGRRPGNHESEREKRNETATETEDKQIEGAPSTSDRDPPGENGNSENVTTSEALPSETDSSPRDEDKDNQKTGGEGEAGDSESAQDDGVTMTDHSEMKKEHGPKSMREKAKKEKAQKDKERKDSGPKEEGKGTEQGPKSMRERTKEEKAQKDKGRKDPAPKGEGEGTEQGPESMREKAKEEKAQKDKGRTDPAPKGEGEGTEQGPKSMREKAKKENEEKGPGVGKDGKKSDSPEGSKVEKPKKETRSKPDKPESEKPPKKPTKEAKQAKDPVKTGRNDGYGSFDPFDTYDDILGTASEETISEDKTTKALFDQPQQELVERKLPVLAFQYSTTSNQLPAEIDYLELTRITTLLLSSMYQWYLNDIKVVRFDKLEVEGYNVVAPRIVQYKVSVFFQDVDTEGIIVPSQSQIEAIAEHGMAKDSDFYHLYLNRLHAMPFGVFASTEDLRCVTNSQDLLELITGRAEDPPTNTKDAGDKELFVPLVAAAAVASLLICIAMSSYCYSRLHKDTSRPSGAKHRPGKTNDDSSTGTSDFRTSFFSDNEMGYPTGLHETRSIDEEQSLNDELDAVMDSLEEVSLDEEDLTEEPPQVRFVPEISQANESAGIDQDRTEEEIVFSSSGTNQAPDIPDCETDETGVVSSSEHEVAKPVWAVRSFQQASGLSLADTTEDEGDLRNTMQKEEEEEEQFSVDKPVENGAQFLHAHLGPKSDIVDSRGTNQEGDHAVAIHPVTRQDNTEVTDPLLDNRIISSHKQDSSQKSNKIQGNPEFEVVDSSTEKESLVGDNEGCCDNRKKPEWTTRNLRPTTLKKAQVDAEDLTTTRPERTERTEEEKSMANMTKIPDATGQQKPAVSIKSSQESTLPQKSTKKVESTLPLWRNDLRPVKAAPKTANEQNTESSVQKEKPEWMLKKLRAMGSTEVDIGNKDKEEGTDAQQQNSKETKEATSQKPEWIVQRERVLKQNSSLSDSSDSASCSPVDIKLDNNTANKEPTWKSKILRPVSPVSKKSNDPSQKRQVGGLAVDNEQAKSAFDAGTTEDSTTISRNIDDQESGNGKFASTGQTETSARDLEAEPAGFSKKADTFKEVDPATPVELEKNTDTEDMQSNMPEWMKKRAQILDRT